MIEHRIVKQSNPWMRLAYLIAKDFYKVHHWNKKTIPVAIIVGPSGEYISHGVCANGMHAILGHCDRLGDPGTPYHGCINCNVNQHAEVLAIENAKFNFMGIVEVLPTIGCSVYIYGHYKSCETCTILMERCGIKEVVFLENAEVLFDRHNPNTVLGTEKQFNV